MSEAARLPFADRRQAGRVLASSLHHLIGRPGLLVLGLPRGGVPVAHEVALALGAPLDVFLVRKLGHPLHEEYAIGAIASGGIRVLDEEAAAAIDADTVERITRRERAELERRERRYRGERAAPGLGGRTVVMVDDGLATGATMRAALQAAREQAPAWLVATAPVGAYASCEGLRALADEVHCPARPTPFTAVGCWYREFEPTSDAEVCRLLAQARARQAQEGTTA